MADKELKAQKKAMKKEAKLAKKGSFARSFKTKSFKAGSYSIVISAIALAVVIVINMIVSQLPSKVTSIDTTTNDLYSIGDYTRQVVGSLDSDITIYLVATAGNEDKTLSAILERYESLSKHIKVETVDPAISMLASKYTDEELEENSLIVISDMRSKVVANSSIYEYSEEMQQYVYYGYDVSPDIFNGENEITSAISYVTSDSLPKVYTLTGHGEYEFADSVTSFVLDSNIAVEALDLFKTGKVPSDCECLIISAPTKDISADEKDMILAYLEAGGNLFVMTDFDEVKTPVFDELMAEYGVCQDDGLIMESDSSNYYYAPYYLMPELSSHEITSAISETGYRIYMPYSQGIRATDSYRSTLSIESILTTSDTSYSKTDLEENSSVEKADGDKEGPFNIGMAVTETHNDTETRIVWIGTTYFLDENFASYTGNMNLLLNSLKWMCDLEENISVVESKSLSGGSLEITSAAGMMWNIVFMGVIPIAAIFTGVVIWARRKKR